MRVLYMVMGYMVMGYMAMVYMVMGYRVMLYMVSLCPSSIQWPCQSVWLQNTAPSVTIAAPAGESVPCCMPLFHSLNGPFFKDVQRTLPHNAADSA